MRPMTAAASEGRVAPSAAGESVPWTARQSPETLGEALPIFLAHGSPRILLACSLAAVLLRLAIGDFSLWDPVVGTALLLYWPLQEWLIHVFVLHWKPIELAGRRIDFDVPRKHRAHHRDPWNHEILFIPLASFVYTIPLVIGVWWLVTPSAALACTGVAAHFLLTLHYEVVHFLIHTRVRPRGRVYERLWRQHRLHHFKNERYWYGVTMRAADGWLGTDPEPDDVPASPTARSLFGEAPTTRTARDGAGAAPR